MAVDSGTYTPGTLATRQRLAEAMLAQGMDTGPIGSPWQGLARIANAMMGGYNLNKLGEQENQQTAAANEALLGFLGGGSGEGAAAASPSLAPPVEGDFSGMVAGDMAAYGDAIASIETPGEKDPYKAKGPVVKSGDRAYGKHQVMGANIGPWTKEILGQEMTPDEFLNSPEAQEAVFAGKFGQYLEKTGSPQDAASMWFTGRPASEAPNARAKGADGKPLGIKGSEYVEKFTKALGAPTEEANKTGIDPNMRRRIGALLANPQTREFGQALITNLIMQKPAAQPAAIQEYEYARSQGYQGTFQEFQVEQRRAGATNVNVGGGDFTKQLGESLGKDFAERRTRATDAAASLTANNEARQLLDSDIITGFGAEYITNVGKALSQIGFNVADDAIANTEAFVASRAQEVAAIIKQFGAGTGLSDADRVFAEKAAGGQITMNKESIRRILDINDRASRNIIKLYNKDAEQIDPETVPFPLTVEAPTFEERPKPDKDTLAPEPDSSAAGPKVGTRVDDFSGLPEGAVIRDTQTGERFIIRNGQRVPIEAPRNVMEAAAP